ncbi:MAG TPA: NTP transferase domain-containing protein, partial [Ignavibacteriaceae bacterium]|nr:NTP transferase domain-containing protein [Ignavibacteriaceae bacterium]
MAKKGKPKKTNPFVLGVIPARFASTRLMGKPLADIGGKSLLQHTYEGASKSKLLDKIVIAVDDEQVAKTAKKFGASVIMTPKDCQTGSDRIAIVAKEFPRADIIVNIQGDEPFISGMMIDQAIEPLIFDPDVNVSTLAKLIDKVEELSNKVTDVRRIALILINTYEFWNPNMRKYMDSKFKVLNKNLINEIGINSDHKYFELKQNLQNEFRLTGNANSDAYNSQFYGYEFYFDMKALVAGDENNIE